MVLVKAEQLEVQNIQFGKLEDNALVKSQKLAFISYKEQKEWLMVRTLEFRGGYYPRRPFFHNSQVQSFLQDPPLSREAHE